MTNARIREVLMDVAYVVADLRARETRTIALADDFILEITSVSPCHMLEIGGGRPGDTNTWYVGVTISRARPAYIPCYRQLASAIDDIIYDVRHDERPTVKS